MLSKILVIAGGILNILWGITHLFPTQSVVNNFGSITIDNKHIILMEWINEGFTLIFLGILAIVTAVMNKDNSKLPKCIYSLIFIMLLSMSILSLLTGFNIDFLPYKLCPFIFSISGILIFQGALRK